MPEKCAQYGLVEMFRPRSEWYALSRDQRQAFLDNSRREIERLLAGGVRFLGVYASRWSSEWHGFSVCECPSAESQQEWIEAAERAGWFRYFEQVNLAGRKMSLDDYFRSLVDL
ncbi:MAG: DUF6616 family protein [Acidobacteriota bacterium]